MVGDFIQKSLIVNTTYDADYINLTTSFALNDIGKGGIGKLKALLSIQNKVVKALLNKHYDLCYMTLTAKGAGFYKDFLVVLLLKLFRKKIVYHFHNKGVLENSRKWYNRVLYKMAFYNTDSILLAPNLYQDIERYVKKDRVHFCPNGIPDIQKKPTAPIVNMNGSGVCRILFLSNMMEEKGVLELLRACQLLKIKGKTFECHFIGAWSDISENRFKSLVRQYDIHDLVYVHGKKYNDEKIPFFQNADIFVFPTYYHNECFPLVLLEAMQYQLPIISTREGAISEMVVDGITGVLVQQKNTKELAEQMEVLIDNPEVRRGMGSAGRQRYKSLYTLDVFENKLISILKKVLNGE